MSQTTLKVIDKIEAKGGKVTRSQVMHAWHVPSKGTSEFPAVATQGNRPEHMWLEEGNQKKGWQHIQERHAQGYISKGIPSDQQREKVPVLAEASTTVGRHIGWGTAKRERGRPVMATYMKGQNGGQVFREALTVSENGFVVSTQPISSHKVRRKPGEPKEVSDKTLQNLYYYPPNCPERRGTHANGQHGERAPAPLKNGTF